MNAKYLFTATCPNVFAFAAADTTELAAKEMLETFVICGHVNVPPLPLSHRSANKAVPPGCGA